MNIVKTRNGREFIKRVQKPIDYNLQSKTITKTNNTLKFWGIWLPIPTFLAIINSLFWTWLILSTVGYSENPLEKAGEWIIEQF